jgi:hypothetical protein
MLNKPNDYRPSTTLDEGDDDFWSELNRAGREAMLGFSAMWPVGVWPRSERIRERTKSP